MPASRRLEADDSDDDAGGPSNDASDEGDHTEMEAAGPDAEEDPRAPWPGSGGGGRRGKGWEDEEDDDDDGGG